MANPRKIPDDQDLVRLIREGMTYKQIAEEWCPANLGTHPVPGAIANYVSRHRERLGLEYGRPRYEEFIPWRVDGKHGTNKAVKMLRVAARLDAGEDVSPQELARFETWRGDLREHDLVVTYDGPDDRIGFKYSRRQPGDRELIRPPLGDNQLCPA